MRRRGPFGANQNTPTGRRSQDRLDDKGLNKPSRSQEEEILRAAQQPIMRLFQTEQLVGGRRDDFVIGGFDGFQAEGLVAVISRHWSAATAHGRVE